MKFTLLLIVVDRFFVFTRVEDEVSAIHQPRETLSRV